MKSTLEREWKSLWHRWAPRVSDPWWKHPALQSVGVSGRFLGLHLGCCLEHLRVFEGRWEPAALGRRDHATPHCIQRFVTGLGAGFPTGRFITGWEMNRSNLRRQWQRRYAGICTRFFTNRLETRTKESTECASVLVIETIRRAMKVRTCEFVKECNRARSGWLS